MDISSLIQSAISKVRDTANNLYNNVNDNQGWYRQGQFAPLAQLQDTGIFNIGNVVDKATHIPSFLGNAQAAGQTVLGSVESGLSQFQPLPYAVKNYLGNSAIANLNSALNTRQQTGTMGSFDQGFGSGLNTALNVAGPAIGTGLTVAGGAKMLAQPLINNVIGTGVGSLIGGGINKLQGGSFKQGALEGGLSTPLYTGAGLLGEKLLAPVISKLNPTQIESIRPYLNILSNPTVSDEAKATARSLLFKNVPRNILASALEAGTGNAIVGATEKANSLQERLGNTAQAFGTGAAFGAGSKALGYGFQGGAHLANQYQQLSPQVTQAGKVQIGSRNYHPDDLMEMNDFMDYVVKQWTPRDRFVYEADIRDMAAKYGINPNQPNGRLAAKFGKILDQSWDTKNNEPKGFTKMLNKMMDQTGGASFTDNSAPEPSQIRGKSNLLAAETAGVPQTTSAVQDRLQTSPQALQKQLSKQLGQGLPPSDLLHQSTLVNDTSVVKKLVGRIKINEKYPIELRQMLEGSYIPKSNRSTIADAKRLVRLDPTAAENRALAPQNAVDQAIGAELFNYHMDKGNVAKANRIINATSGTNEGQMIQILSQYDKTTPQGAIKFANNAVKSYNEVHPNSPINLSEEMIKDIYATAKKVQAMPEGRARNIASQALIDKVSALVPSSLADKALTVWKAGLLTSLRTHERNLFGNTIMGTSEILKDVPATLADKALSLATGKRTLTTTLSGRLQGAKTGARAMVDVATLGFDPQESIQKFEVNRVNWANNPVEQFLKKATDLVYRPLAGEDKVFWHSAFAGSLYDQAGAEAINAGQQGNRTFIENLVKNPTEQMKLTALNDANYATFHDKNGLSSIASGLKQAARKLPGLQGETGKIVTEVLMPFTGVPSSIVGKTVAYSPLGLVKGAIDFGRVALGQVPELQRQAAQEVGRGVLGTGLFGLGAFLVNKGLMTGQPKDATEAALWQAQGKQANSVLIGGKWRSINSVGPQALIALAGAKLQEELNKPDGSVGNFALNLGKDQLSQTFLSGVQQPLNALTDPARYGKSYVGNLISSAVPNIVKDTSKAFDPNARETNTSLDYLKQAIPGIRNTLLPKRDNLGNIVPQEPTGVSAFFDLFNSRIPIDNTVINEIARLAGEGQNALPSKLTPSQTILKQKVKLTFQQLDSLEAGVGQVLKPQLEALITSPTYQQLGDEQKAKAIDDLVSSVRTEYKNLNASNILSGSGQPLGTTNISASNNAVAYVDENGNYKTIDIGKILSMPSDTNYQKQLKQEATFKILDNLQNANLDPTTLSSTLSKLGINQSQFDYYNIARQSDAAKTAWLQDKLTTLAQQGGTHADLINTLAQGRAQVGGKSIVSTGVLTNLYENGLITYPEKRALAQLNYNNRSGLRVKSGTGKVKKIKFSKPKKLSMGKLGRLKKTRFKKIKITTPRRPLKFKLSRQTRIRAI